ncbi:hypothetical protein HZR84_06235 [Hyphobacterium sp. CCMP332]|nr:hypothetical protein HZR84_06235 [Hyphobacterium sp. CCMP332]
MDILIKSVLGIIVSIALLSCNNDDSAASQNPVDNIEKFYCSDSINPMCTEKVLIDPLRFDTASNDQLSVLNLGIVDNCMEIEYGASGCDGSTWRLTLLDSGSLYKNNPPTRKLKFDFHNAEICLAYFVKKKSFDLCPLKQPGVDSLILIVSDTTLIYRY